MSPAAFATDEELLVRLKARDEQAFRELVNRYHSMLVTVARGYVSNRASAEDVAQETWMGVVRGIDAFEGRSSIKTWLYRIAANRAKTRGIKEGRSLPFASLGSDDEAGPVVDADRFDGMGMWNSPLDDWDDDPLARLTSAETLAFVDETLLRLPEQQRMVVTLRDRQGWTSAEVCDALGLTEANQRVLLHRGRAKVRAALESHLQAEAA